MTELEKLCKVSMLGGEIERPRVKYLPSNHATYKINGKRVVGASTVAGRDPDGKQQLIGWANKMGLKGIDTNAFLIHAANIGTMAHKMVELYLGGCANWGFMSQEINTLYSGHANYETYLDHAINCYNKYMDFSFTHRLTPLHTELPLVHYPLMYGGTIDIYGELGGRKVLIDLKTSSSIYRSHLLQVAGYYQLLKANYYPIDDVYILQISREEGEPYKFKKVDNLDRLFEDFKDLLRTYNRNKEKK